MLSWNGTVFFKHIQWNVQRKSVGMKKNGILVTRQISILVTANMLSWIIINRQKRPRKVHCKGFMSTHLSPIKSCHSPTNESLEGLRAHKDIISSLPALWKLDEKSTQFLGIIINSTASTLLCFLPSDYWFGYNHPALLSFFADWSYILTLMQIRCL